MNTQTITIEKTKTVAIGDLSITNVGGGHKILISQEGQGGGDVSFTNLALETPRKAKEIMRIMNSSETLKTPFVFDTYLITIQKIGWDGDSVTLSIAHLS